MGTKEFLKLCVDEVVKHYNTDPEMNTKIEVNDVFEVWNCKTLQNNKALLSTSVSGDGRYYECTFNGDRKELYLDVYDKKENKCIHVN